MQCKDIETAPILLFLKNLRPHLGTWFDMDCENTVRHAFPKKSPDRLVLAKMASLIRRGLVTGCCCACRGDYEITDKGLEYLTDRNEIKGNKMIEIESKYQIPKEISPNPWLKIENPPQNDEVVLVTDGEVIEEGRYYEDEWCGSDIDPTHWMPRPSLPLPKRK